MHKTPPTIASGLYPCANCGHLLTEHDGYVARCLFNPNTTWVAADLEELSTDALTTLHVNLAKAAVNESDHWVYLELHDYMRVVWRELELRLPGWRVLQRTL